MPEIMARSNVGRDAVALAIVLHVWDDDAEAVAEVLRIMHEKGLKDGVLRALKGMRDMREEAELLECEHANVETTSIGLSVIEVCQDCHDSRLKSLPPAGNGEFGRWIPPCCDDWDCNGCDGN